MRYRLLLGLLATIALPAYGAEPTRIVPALRFEQAGKLPDGASQSDMIVLANEPGSEKASMALDFDLEFVGESMTPLARLHLDDVVKVAVKRPGQKNTGERGVVHVFMPDGSGGESLIGVLPVKAGGFTNPYVIDVTPAVNAALSRAQGQKKLHLELRLEGQPLYYEVYGIRKAEGIALPGLEIASADNWTDDWKQRLAPITSGAVVYREPCLPIADTRNTETALPLLYPAKKVVEVIANASGEKLQEGRDWTLRDGKLVLPAGSQAPIQLTKEFFSAPHKDKSGEVKNLPTSVRLMEGTWYHERQIAVTYEPVTRDWLWPAPLSSIDKLPRLQNLLATKAPITMVLFGDSISAGGNASKFQGAWPYQPSFGELVCRAVEDHYGSKVTFLNHSRAGATSSYATGQVDSQVAWFEPDLVIIAYGMNDRADGRREGHRANLEKIIDTVRARSPKTEFIVVTPMLNNPKQPTGLEPVKFIRDEALKIERPGVAFVDITSTHLEVMKHKSYLDLSGNGANHPNDFLHRIYAQRILEVLIPATTTQPK